MGDPIVTLPTGGHAIALNCIHVYGCVLLLRVPWTCQVSVEDAGEAGAVIVANPAKHVGKTYTIAGPLYSHADLAAAFTASTGKPVQYVQVPYAAAEASFLEKGWPAWQVTGLLQLFKQVDAGAYGFADEDFTAITGKAAKGVTQWVDSVKLGFQ